MILIAVDMENYHTVCVVFVFFSTLLGPGLCVVGSRSDVELEYRSVKRVERSADHTDAARRALSSLEKEKLKLLMELQLLKADTDTADSAETELEKAGDDDKKGENPLENGQTGSMKQDKLLKNVNFAELRALLMDAADDVLEMRDRIADLELATSQDQPLYTTEDSQHGDKLDRLKRDLNDLFDLKNRKNNLNTILRELLVLKEAESEEGGDNGSDVKNVDVKGKQNQDSSDSSDLHSTLSKNHGSEDSYRAMMGERSWHESHCKGLIQYCGGFHFNCCDEDSTYGVNMCCYWGSNGRRQDTRRRYGGICIPSVKSRVTCLVNN